MEFVSSYREIAERDHPAGYSHPMHKCMGTPTAGTPPQEGNFHLEVVY